MCWLVRLSLFGCCLIAAGAAAQEVSAPVDDVSPLDEVVVTGVRPGPRMWKITHNDHELWILGVVDPLPEKLQWQSQQVQQVLAVSQAVLLDNPSVALDAGLFARLGLYLKWQGMQKNPEGRQLREVLPADLHARFTALQQRYSRNNDLERFRPIIAAARLYQAAVGRMGLSSRQAVSKSVEKLARRQDLKPQRARLKVSEPRELLESLNRIPLDAEVRCLAATLTNLESDLHTVRERANAWALGDLPALRAAVNSDNRAACWEVLTTVPRVAQLTQQADQEWLSLAEAALQHNRSTLALHAMRELLAADGVLAWFRARGYDVTEP